MIPESTNTYDSVYPSIIDVTSRELDNLVLLYGSSGRNTNRLTALGFRIGRTQRRVEHLTTEPSLAAQGNAGDTLDFGYIGENGHQQDVSDPGSEIYQIESERASTLVEYGFEITPDGVLTAIDSGGAVIMGMREGSDRRRGYATGKFNSFAAVDSRLTQVDAPDTFPTTALSGTPRQGVFRIDSDENGLNRFRLGFQNTTAGQVDVGVAAVGQTYQVDVVSDAEQVRDMVSRGGVPARKVTYGSFPTTNPNLPREWNDHTVSVNLGDVSLGSN